MRAVLVVAALVLAGCSSSDPPALTAEECKERGLELRSIDGVASCETPRPPATVLLAGPATVGAYTLVEFEWILETHLARAHAMRTEARFVLGEAGEPGAPDAWGTKVGGAEHQDFESGARYTASFRPSEAGTYTVRAYAQVNNTHQWSGPLVLEVLPVAPTGEVRTVTIKPGGPLAELDPATTTATLGDGVRFQNDDLVERTFTWTGPAEVPTTQVDRLAGSDTVVFLVPGTYRFASTDAVRPLSGEVVVRVPDAPAL